MNIEYNINNYIFTHGRKPKGYGAWAFQEHKNPNAKIYWVYNATFSEAKKQISKLIREMNLVTDYVEMDVLT